MFRSKLIRKLCIIAFWLLIWLLVALAVDNSILVVTPQAVVARFGQLLAEASFWQALFRSLIRIGVGFLLGVFVALGLAGISSRYSVAEEVLQPLIGLMKTVPVAAFVVLLLIWWGSSVLAVAICFLVVMPNIYINTLEGLKATDKSLLEMAKVFDMPARNRFFYIYRPAVRPFLESGLRISLGMCWKSGVAAEVIGMPEYSIGGQLYLSKIHLDTAGVLAWTAVVILLSLCFERVILWLTDRFFEWNPSAERADRHRKCGTSEAGDYKGLNLDVRPIKLSHVSKSYGENMVLRDVSATYEEGGAYYLTSPSGSGKTTLLRLVCGLETPDDGRIERVGKCSMVFQEDRLCEDYTAIQNVMMVTGDYEGAVNALEDLLCEEAIRKPCRQLSGGMKRRVALVRAMEASSEVVLLDEPFTGMDVDTKGMAEEYIRKRQNGRILIIATHI